MKKDIPENIVEDVGIAVVQEEGELLEVHWAVYVVNFKSEPIYNVMVTSKGYGKYEGKQVKTSTLRHFFEEIPPKSFARIEQISEHVFGLSNEFWLSFYINKQIYDKKYIFLAESIVEENLITVPLLNKKGVMIK